MEKRFRFPWAVAGAAFMVYALTLCRGVTLNSLPLAAKVAGWDWVPLAGRPLLWLLTLPLHLLPGGWIPVALNLFSAAAAALTLGVLARSSELLPWVTPPDEEKIWARRLPVLLACAAVGLEFNFWSAATAATGEAVDLLALAVAIWCLLEYRLEKNPRWLNAAALAWGAGMAENWAMLLTLPLFIAALVWLRGMRFFKVRFLLRLAGLVLAGFSIYALPPLAAALTPHSPQGFGEAWRAAGQTDKMIFHLLYGGFWRAHRLLAFCVLLYFLMPTLPCLLRLKNETAANQSKLDLFQTRLFRALRAGLLLVCLWLAFDPAVGPREILRQQLGVAMPLLTFDYLDALGIAFLAGNLLYAAQVPPPRRSRSFPQKINSWLRRRAAALLTALALLAVAGLLARSLPAVRLANRQPLEQFGALVVRSLPAGGGILLGEDALKLMVVQAALAPSDLDRRWAVADIRLLPDEKYRAALQRKFPLGWTAAENQPVLSAPEMLRLLDGLARTNRLEYLQPMAGNFIFERFYPSPSAAIYELKNYGKKELAPPPLTPAQISANEKFWDDAWRGGLQSVGEQCSAPPTAWPKILAHYLALAPVASGQPRLLGEWHSAQLNQWGVALQEAGKLAGAHRRFEQASALNQSNAAVAVNLQCNTNLLAGKKMGLAEASPLAGQFRTIQELGQAVSRFGPFDEPVICCLFGSACAAAGWPRQAFQEFTRAQTLAPDAIAPRFARAQIYSSLRLDAQVFESVRQIRALATNAPVNDALQVQLSLLEARSWFSQTNPATANRILESILAQHPGDAAVADPVFQTYLAFGEATNALQILDRQLAADPDNLAALNNRAGILMQLNDPGAVTNLDRALAITNLPALRLNRAITRLEMKDYAAAEKDFLQVQNDPAADQFSVAFGLAEIAAHRHDTNAARRLLEHCLASAPPQSPRWQMARARLDALEKPPSP